MTRCHRPRPQLSHTMLLARPVEITAAFGGALIRDVSSRDGLPGSSGCEGTPDSPVEGRTRYERRRSQEPHDRITEGARCPARARSQRTPHVAAENDGSI